MKRIHVLLLVGVLLSSFSLAVPLNTPREVPGVILMKLSDTAPVSALDRVRSLHGVQRIESGLSTAATQTIDNTTFTSWKKVRVAVGSEKEIVDEIRMMGVAKVVYQMRHMVINAVPSPDSLTPRQWALTQVHAFDAWKVTTGSSNVILGVIDTGCDINHPDLAPSIWTNPDETDSNHVDDDHNGFVDDIHGWNFVDNNNDVSDVYGEFGHGTGVAGVMVAAANHIGIIGLAPTCRLMVLRAGDANGFLDEDNVATALVYATENGCRVVNMSFGDTQVAPLLRDAIEFAFSRGVILVASAGNSGDDTQQYPSGYEPVISVGATGRDGYRASFSTYGSTLALVAPGDVVLTTENNGSWGTSSGTSFSAPYAAAAAGLLLSRDSTLTPAEVRMILCVSADDAGRGWNIEYGHGKLDANHALQTTRQAEARILSPADGTRLATDTLTVSGTVAGPRLLSWSLDFGASSNPTNWQIIRAGVSAQRVRDSLGFIHIGSEDTTFTIRLIAQVGDGNPYQTRVVVNRDASAPTIIRKYVTPALVNGKWGWRFEASTDDETRAAIQWTHGGIVQFRPFPFIDTQHALPISTDDNLFSGDSVQFIFTNLSGLVQASNKIVVPALPQQLSSWPLVEIPNMSLPNGNLLPRQVNVWNRSNRPDVMLNVYTPTNAYDSLWLFEWRDTAFVRRVYYGTIIAQDARDVTGDGIPDVMLRVNGITELHARTAWFDSITGEHYPDPDTAHILIPRDSGGYYGAGLFDFDPNDRAASFITRHDATYEVWTINWNTGGNFTPEFNTVIHNPTRGSNGLGRPRFRVGNIVGDGSVVGLWGDTDGDIILSKRLSPNSWQNIWTDSLGEGDATDYLEVGDFDGDGVDEFIAGYQTASRVQSEHEAPLKKWVYYLYKWNEVSGKPVRIDSLIIDGANDPHVFDAGVESGDLNGDGAKEIFISASPYLLVMTVDRATHHLHIVYQALDARSNTVAMFNVRNNGRPELVYNTGTKFKFLEWSGSTASSPLVPSGVVAQPLDTAHILVSWNPVTGAASYRMLRARGNSPFDTIRTIAGTSYLDSLAIDTTVSYQYAIAAYDPTLAQPLGTYSVIVSARPNHPPQLLSANTEAENDIRIIFSEPVSAASQVPNRFRLGSSIYPVSVLASHQGSQLLLRFDPRPDPGNYTLTLGSVIDFENTPLNGPHTITVNFPVVTAKTFFLADAKIIDGTFLLTMSLPYDSVAATTMPYPFHVTPNIAIERIETIDSVTLRLIPSPGTPIGALGAIYQITVLPALHASARYNAQALDSHYASRAISTQPIALQPLFIYPNPARLDRGDMISIAGLPRDTKITIFTTTGMKVKTLIADPASGGVIWDGTNNKGAALATGIYVVIAEKNGAVQKSKVALVR